VTVFLKGQKVLFEYGLGGRGKEGLTHWGGPWCPWGSRVATVAEARGVTSPAGKKEKLTMVKKPKLLERGKKKKREGLLLFGEIRVHSLKAGDLSTGGRGNSSIERMSFSRMGETLEERMSQRRGRHAKRTPKNGLGSRRRNPKGQNERGRDYKGNQRRDPESGIKATSPRMRVERRKEMRPSIMGQPETTDQTMATSRHLLKKTASREHFTAGLTCRKLEREQ